MRLTRYRVSAFLATALIALLITSIGSASTPLMRSPVQATPSRTPPPVRTPTQVPATGATYYLATDGNDANPGTETQPFRSFTAAMPKLQAGDMLLVRGGTYTEIAKLRGSDLAAGTADARITVRAFPNERPVIQGILWLSNADYWTIEGISVTWDPNYAHPQEPMVRFYGGTGWILQHGELWGARSYAALLITEYASGWNVNHMTIHDTQSVNGLNQDHLIYLAGTSQGVIEYNLLYNSPNGRGIKIGQDADGTGLPNEIVVRYNTIVNSGAGNIGYSYDARSTDIHHNIMVQAGTSWTNVAAFNARGTNNVVSNNIGWQSAGMIPTGGPLVDGGGNQVLDPQLDAGYLPHNPTLYDANGVLQYGHLAGATR